MKRLEQRVNLLQEPGWNDGPAQSGPPWQQEAYACCHQGGCCQGSTSEWGVVLAVGQVSRQAVSADGFSVGDLGKVSF